MHTERRKIQREGREASIIFLLDGGGMGLLGAIANDSKKVRPSLLILVLTMDRWLQGLHNKQHFLEKIRLYNISKNCK
jgi:hypothetical protein